MIKQISKSVWQFHYLSFGSNCYLIKTPSANVLVDTSSAENRNDLIKDLLKASLKQKDISIILLTHMHYDHIGNLLAFRNATAYASEKEISDFYKNPAAVTLAEMPYSDIESIKTMLRPISEFKNQFFKVIKSPGHTHGSLCFFMPREKILFSGDTLFEYGIGRTDLPTSDEEGMNKSLEGLRKLGYKILCAGH